MNTSTRSRLTQVQAVVGIVAVAAAATGVFRASADRAPELARSAARAVLDVDAPAQAPAVAAPSPSATTTPADPATSIALTAEQITELKALTATPEKVEKLASTINETFTGVATAGAAAPATAAAQPGVVQAANTASAVPALAYGFNGHVWMTASYADIAKGLISGAVRFCKTRLPGWLCTYLGNIVTNWARGWAPLSNHGVWGAVYWNRVEGGRW